MDWIAILVWFCILGVFYFAYRGIRCIKELEQMFYREHHARIAAQKEVDELREWRNNQEKINAYLKSSCQKADCPKKDCEDD